MPDPKGFDNKDDFLKVCIPQLVKEGKITNIDQVFSKGLKLLEPQIIDKLLNLRTDLIAVGQAKGKFGGGKRRAWRQTQKKTAEGNTPTFSCMAVDLANYSSCPKLCKAQSKLSALTFMQPCV